MYISDEDRVKQQLFGKKVQKLFGIWANKNKDLTVEEIPDDSPINMNDKIDYFLTIPFNGRDYIKSIDVKSPCINEKYHNDIVNINYEDTKGNPGTMQLSKADYYAILGKCNTDNSWRYFVVNANVLKNYAYTELTPHYGRNKSRYYSISISEWVNHNWTF